jgi:uncharacterized repeat protein (TIGR04138 family)
MTPPSDTFPADIEKLCTRDSRYAADAYFFLVEALNTTTKKHLKENPNRDRHVTGQELSEGIRDVALEEFGPMAYTVFSEWGIRSTSDFGEIVYNLIDIGRLGKTDSDSKADFNAVFDFDEAFRAPFQPQNNIPATPPKRGKPQATA